VLLFLDILYAYTALMLLFGCAHLCSILCGAALPAPPPMLKCGAEHLSVMRALVRLSCNGTLPCALLSAGRGQCCAPGRAAMWQCASMRARHHRPEHTCSLDQLHPLHHPGARARRCDDARPGDQQLAAHRPALLQRAAQPRCACAVLGLGLLRAAALAAGCGSQAHGAARLA
jgi:hypothetical protein